MSFDKREYDKGYTRDNISRVSLSFHHNKNDEMLLLERFNDYCNNTKQKKNDIIIDAIREYLDKYDK